MGAPSQVLLPWLVAVHALKGQLVVALQEEQH